MMTVTGGASSSNSRSGIAGGTATLTANQGRGGIKLEQRTRYIRPSCCVSITNMRFRYTIITVAASQDCSFILIIRDRYWRKGIVHWICTFPKQVGQAKVIAYALPNSPTA